MYITYITSYVLSGHVTSGMCVSERESYKVHHNMYIVQQVTDLSVSWQVSPPLT